MSDRPTKVKHIIGCARCGQDHDELTMTYMARPMGCYEAWAACPTNGDPILISFVRNTAQEVIMTAIDEKAGGVERLTYLVENWPQPYDPVSATAICYVASQIEDDRLKVAAAKLFVQAAQACGLWAVLDKHEARIQGKADTQLIVPEPDVSKLIVPGR